MGLRYRYIIATLAVFGAIGADRALLRPSAVVAEPYHRRMREAAAAMPTNFGDWLGLDTPVPEAAVRMLHPNVILSRQYQNMRTGESVSFLLVQVSDARDILGHYPPVCYPSQGWTTSLAEERVWTSSIEVHGMEYRFRRDHVAGEAELTVANFLFLPDGRTCRLMSEVESEAQSRLRKLFGAGQVQVVFGPGTQPARRTEIIEEFINMVAPITTLPATGD